MVALFVVLTIALCVTADSVVQWRRARREREARRLAEGLAPAYELGRVSAPAGVFLDEGHTWVQVAPTGSVAVGVDGFARALIGHVDAVDLPPVGKEVRRGDVLFALRQGDRRAAFAAPLDGVVSAVDEELAWHPEVIESAPYDEGWVCALEPKNLARDLRQLHLAEEARDWLRGEAHKFQEFCAARPLEETRLGRAPRDGRRPAAAPLELLDDGTWRQFTDEFLRPHVH